VLTGVGLDEPGARDAGRQVRLLPKVVGGVSIEDSLTAFFVRALG